MNREELKSITVFTDTECDLVCVHQLLLRR
jgi:hypothetical protein